MGGLYVCQHVHVCVCVFPNLIQSSFMLEWILNYSRYKIEEKQESFTLVCIQEDITAAANPFCDSRTRDSEYQTGNSQLYHILITRAITLYSF